MINKISDTSFSNQDRLCVINHEDKSFPIALIGRRSYIIEANLEYFDPEHTSLIIGNYCAIAHEVTFMMNMNQTHDHLSVSNYPFSKVFALPLEQKSKIKGSIIIGHDVWIGRGATIMGGVVIGNGAIIAANSVVTKSVEPYAFVGGNPAKFIKYRFDEDMRLKLNEVNWWYMDENQFIRNSYFIQGDVEGFIEQHLPVLEKRRLIERKKPIIYALIVSQDTAFSVWKNVVRQFVEQFSSEDKVKLKLVLKNDQMTTEILVYLESLGVTKEDLVCVQSVIDEREIEMMFESLHYVITDRSHDTLKSVNLANLYGVRILFGADKKIFQK